MLISIKFMLVVLSKLKKKPGSGFVFGRSTHVLRSNHISIYPKWISITLHGLIPYIKGITIVVTVTV